MPEDIEKIIDDKIREAGFDDPLLARALGNSLFALTQHREGIKKSLLARLESELAGRRDKVWLKVLSALVPARLVEDMARRGFYPVCEQTAGIVFSSLGLDPFADQPMEGKAKSDLPLGPFFLDCDYRYFSELCRKPLTGRVGGKEFTYELKPDYSLVEAESVLTAVCQLYGLPVPALYLPMSRHAVVIHVHDDIQSMPGELACFDFEGNGLAGKLLTDCVLMWNLEVSEPSGEVSSIAPREDHPVWTLLFADDINSNTFVLPDMSGYAPHGPEQIEVRKSGNEIRFSSPRKLPELFFKINITKTDNIRFSDSCTVFHSALADNDSENILVSKERLRTRGDVDLVLSALAHDGMRGRFDSVIDGIAAAGEDTPVTRYEKLHRYQYRGGKLLDEEDLFLRLKKKPVCRIRFFAQQENRQLTDYANSVLAYLELRYPEFCWTGVI